MVGGDRRGLDGTGGTVDSKPQRSLGNDKTPEVGQVSREEGSISEQLR